MAWGKCLFLWVCRLLKYVGISKPASQIQSFLKLLDRLKQKNIYISKKRKKMPRVLRQALVYDSLRETTGPNLSALNSWSELAPALWLKNHKKKETRMQRLVQQRESGSAVQRASSSFGRLPELLQQAASFLQLLWSHCLPNASHNLPIWANAQPGLYFPSYYWTIKRRRKNTLASSMWYVSNQILSTILGKVQILFSIEYGGEWGEGS